MIEPSDWKKYFLLASIDNIDDLIYHWRYSTVYSFVLKRFLFFQIFNLIKIEVN